MFDGGKVGNIWRKSKFRNKWPNQFRPPGLGWCFGCLFDLGVERLGC